jgi:SAM-dependent methyltransferase
MVVEHLDNPDTQFREVSRVLRPGGVFLFHTPNALGYFTMLARVVPRPIKLRFVYLLDGRTPEDVFPAYYRANSRRRIERLAHMTGLQVERFTLLVTDAMFAPVPPLAFVELLWLRILMTRHFKPLRTNIIAVMRKQAV